MRKMLPLSIFVLAIASTMSAQVTFTFSTVDVPGSIFTRAHNINHQGDIVGLFAIVRGTGHGFLLHIQDRLLPALVASTAHARS